jgi:putative DNA primase/helicase
MSYVLRPGQPTIVQLATLLWGEPNPAFSSKDDIRFGNKGSKSVCPSRNLWRDYEADVRGGYVSLRALVDGELSKERASTTPTSRGPLSDPQKADLARELWSEATDPAETIVRVYLRRRGVDLPEEPVIRFHPRCRCGKDRLPAMVALMTDPATAEPCGIHRTFLKPDGSGKADIGSPKRMLGPAGVIRLAEQITDGLGLAEGIETALNVIQRLGWGPVWATGSAGGIRNFPVRPVTVPNIFIDRDDDGVSMKAAEACAERYVAAGLEAYIHEPPAGQDWADAAQGSPP